MKNFLLAFRMLKNFRFYSAVNIVGLALSLACTIAIARYIYVEYSVDNCHSKVENICCVLSEKKTNGTQLISDINQFHSAVLNPEKDPAVLMHTAVIKLSDPIITVGNTEYNGNVLRVDSTFCKIFDFPIITGDPTICSGTYDAAITREYAKKLFGDQNPIGKSFILATRLITIKTVIGKPATKNSLQFDLLVNYNFTEGREGFSFEFMLLTPGQTAEMMNQRHSQYDENGCRYQFASLKEIYFMPEVCSVNNRFALITGNRSSVHILSIVGCIILLIGLFNFINIYTVLMLRRGREMGLKKVFGASVRSIITGVYLENLLLVTLSVIIGWFLVIVSQGLIIRELGIPMVYNWHFDILLSLGILVLLPVITSVYPYFKTKYTKTVTSIQKVNTGGRSFFGRALFLVLQYIMTIVIVIISLFFVYQLKYMLSADVGYRSRGIIETRMFLPIPSWVPAEKRAEQQMIRSSKMEIVKQKMDASPLFSIWQYIDSPNKISAWTPSFSFNGNDYQEVDCIYCSKEYLSLFGLRLKAGHWWNDSTNMETGYDLIANEALLQKFGIQDYSTAQLQPKERLWTNNDQQAMQQNPPYNIIGIIENFQIGHFTTGIRPIIILPDNGDFAVWNDLCAYIVPGKEAEAVEFLRQLHHEAGSGEFKYTMIEDEIAATYAEDKKVTLIYSVFAVIAILIGSLGLFSLSLYDVQQRYREIALRRVNGAKEGQIVTMLLRKYYLLLGLAFLIAIPVAWYAIHLYMQDFIVKAPLRWWIFALAAMITAAIALLTLIYQTVKAARTNPACAMKLE